MRKMLAGILFFLFVFSGFIYADYIKLNNKKVYKGFITEYDSGKYFIIINGKKYPIPENRVTAIKWEAAQEEIDEMFAEFPVEKKDNRDTSHFLKFYADVSIDFISVFQENVKKQTGSLLFYPSVTVGYTNEVTFLGLKTSFINFPRGSNETYTSPSEDSLGIYCMPSIRQLIDFGFFDLRLGMDVGGGIEMSGHAGIVPGFLGEFKLEVPFEVSESLNVSVFSGFTGFTILDYTPEYVENSFGSFWYDSDSDFGFGFDPFPDVLFGSGLTFGVEIKYVIK